VLTLGRGWVIVPSRDLYSVVSLVFMQLFLVFHVVRVRLSFFVQAEDGIRDA